MIARSGITKCRYMKISGFTMVKNATKLYYPIKEVIASILPIVDEYVVALGDCDQDDKTREAILSLDSDKIKIIDTVWDIQKYPNGMENAHQTDIAKDACTGDWLLHLQADEVIHEKYHQTIVEACQKHLTNQEVEAMVFKYRHFWGDYDHAHISHVWYPYEVRIVRNDPDIHSWQSAQSFRRIPNFDRINYRVKEGTHKLRAILLDAYVFHYGWVRPPSLMQKKQKALNTIHQGEKRATEIYENVAPRFDYGPLARVARFTDSHPKVMEEMIAKFDWKDSLNYTSTPKPNTITHKHEKPKYRILSFLEQNLLGGRQIGGFRNFIKVKG